MRRTGCGRPPRPWSRGRPPSSIANTGIGIRVVVRRRRELGPRRRPARTPWPARPSTPEGPRPRPRCTPTGSRWSPGAAASASPRPSRWCSSDGAAGRPRGRAARRRPPTPPCSTACRAAGLEVIEVPVYEWRIPDDPRPAIRLAEARHRRAGARRDLHGRAPDPQLAGHRRRARPRPGAARAPSTPATSWSAASARSAPTPRSAPGCRADRLVVPRRSPPRPAGARRVPTPSSSRTATVRLAGRAACCPATSCGSATGGPSSPTPRPACSPPSSPAAGVVLAKEELLRAVWGDAAGDTHVVEVTVGRLPAPARRARRRHHRGPTARLRLAVAARCRRLLNGGCTTVHSRGHTARARRDLPFVGRETGRIGAPYGPPRAETILHQVPRAPRRSPSPSLAACGDRRLLVSGQRPDRGASPSGADERQPRREVRLHPADRRRRR